MIHVTILSKNRCKKNLKDFRTYHLYRTAAAQSSCTKWAARYIVLARVRRSMTSLLAHWHLRAVASCRCETISETIFLIKKMNDATVSITLAGCFKLCFPQKFLRNWREYSEELWWKGTSIDYNWRQKKSETIVTLKKDPRFPESLPYWSFFFWKMNRNTNQLCGMTELNVGGETALHEMHWLWTYFLDNQRQFPLLPAATITCVDSNWNQNHLHAMHMTDFLKPHKPR